jgi:hypothetical protein
LKKTITKKGWWSGLRYILGYKASFNKCKKTPVTSCILSDYIGIKHNINSKKATENIQTQRLKNVLRDQWSLKK